MRLLNVLIPMAGGGRRFKDAGYKRPKPLVDVLGAPMIQRVIQSSFSTIWDCATFIFICQRDHLEDHCLDYILKLLVKHAIIVPVEGITEGAACTCLLAKQYINNNDSLIIANSDQIVKLGEFDILVNSIYRGLDGWISLFKANEPKWSYARLTEESLVDSVAEKVIISENATTGIYGWSHGRDFVKYAEQMIASNKRVNGEFYVCPVYNEAIADGKKISGVFCKEMHGLGDPESLEKYIKQVQSKSLFYGGGLGGC